MGNYRYLRRRYRRRRSTLQNFPRSISRKRSVAGIRRSFSYADNGELVSECNSAPTRSATRRRCILLPS